MPEKASFYTSEFISPREKYRKSDADSAIDEARFVVDEVSKILKATDG